MARLSPIAGGAFLWLAVLATSPAASRADSPTFNRDVAPIIFTKCAGCHGSGRGAPMSLTTFGEVRPWAQSIKQKILSREMPPWRADPRFGRFRNDPSLTATEIDTIVAWVDGGAREGSGPLPDPPQLAPGWNHPSGRPPDVILDAPIEFHVPAEGVLPPFAVYSELPPELAAEDHFVEAVQLLPSSAGVVHHATFSMRALPKGVALGSGPAWPGGPTIAHIPVLVDRSPAGLSARRDSSAAEVFSAVGTSHFVFFFPGNKGFVQFPAGAGKRIRHQDYVEWAVHYSPSGRATVDRERVGLWLQKTASTHETLTMRIGDFHIVNGNEVVLPANVETSPGHAAIVSVPGSCGGLPCPQDKSMIPVIPPRAANWKITGITPFQDDVTLQLAYPHGHLRLTDMTYVVTYPDGREETILSVPKYDFNWQLVYEWAEPLHVPAGSTIKAIAHYDNSPNNRLNPSPNSEVVWSEQSTDEMFNGFVDMSIDKMDVRFEGNRTVGEPVAPRIPLVMAVGCVATDAAGTPLLTNATIVRQSHVLHADADEIAQARNAALGRDTYRLVGTADFSPVGELLATGQRALFTSDVSANTTAALMPRRKVAVKALMISGTPATLNLVSVQPAPDDCH
jgi:mono/diheme cytochrome c family protein